jgi:hypothetical protein
MARSGTGESPQVSEHIARLPVVAAIQLNHLTVRTNERGHQRVYDLTSLRPVLQAKELGNIPKPSSMKMVVRFI